MTPYYEQSGITIYCADCRAVLPSLCSASLLLTDPPYGIGLTGAAGSSRKTAEWPDARDTKQYGTVTWDDKPVPAWLLQQAIELCQQAIIWGGNFYDLPPSSCWLVWDKEIAGNFADCELAWTNLSKAVQRIRYLWGGYKKAAPEHRWHPTQKPEAVMLWSIQQATFPRETALILDPFMGSGTTLVAAKRLGHRAIGIEREERYCEIAANRLRQDALPLMMDEPLSVDAVAEGHEVL